MSDDPELAALRAQRLAQLQAQGGGGGGGAGGGEAAQQQQESQKMARHAMLSRILDQAARARLNSLAVVKPEKAEMVENMLIRMAQSGQIGGRVDEEQLKSFLEQVSAKTSKKTVVNFRRVALDDDDSSGGSSDSDED